MATAKLKRGTIQHVESELYAYHETKKEIVRLKNEILYNTPSYRGHIGYGSGNMPSDPIAGKAVLIVSHRMIEQLERIVEAIEMIYQRMPEERQKLIRLKYWTKSRHLTWEGIALEVGVHRATALRWRDEFVKEVADRIGWR